MIHRDKQRSRSLAAVPISRRRRQQRIFSFFFYSHTRRTSGRVAKILWKLQICYIFSDRYHRNFAVVPLRSTQQNRSTSPTSVLHFNSLNVSTICTILRTFKVDRNEKYRILHEHSNQHDRWTNGTHCRSHRCASR